MGATFASCQLASCRPASGRRSDTERGDIVLGWLTKIVVVLALAGLGFFDAISVAVTATTLSDQGRYAARDASETWQQTGNLQQAYDAAVKSATEQNPANSVDNQTFRIDPDDTVHLRISRTATSLLLFRWSPTAEWAQLEREASGRGVG